LRSREHKYQEAEGKVIDQVAKASIELGSVKYTLVNIGKLLELLQWFRNGCKCVNKQLGGKWNFVSQNMEGHALILGFQCNSCGTSKEWKSSGG
jgi:hypothetical protein